VRLVSVHVVFFHFSNDIVNLNPFWYFREYLFVNGYLYKMFNFKTGPAHAEQLEAANVGGAASADGSVKAVDA